MVDIKLKDGRTLQPLKDLMVGNSNLNAVKSLRKALFLGHDISELLFFMLNKINDITIQIQEIRKVEKKLELLNFYDFLEKIMKLVEAVVINNTSSGKTITNRKFSQFKIMIERLIERKTK